MLVWLKVITADSLANSQLGNQEETKVGSSHQLRRFKELQTPQDLEQKTKCWRNSMGHTASGGANGQATFWARTWLKKSPKPKCPLSVPFPNAA